MPKASSKHNGCCVFCDILLEERTLSGHRKHQRLFRPTTAGATWLPGHPWSPHTVQMGCHLRHGSRGSRLRGQRVVNEQASRKGAASCRTHEADANNRQHLQHLRHLRHLRCRAPPSMPVTFANPCRANGQSSVPKNSQAPACLPSSKHPQFCCNKVLGHREWQLGGCTCDDSGQKHPEASVLHTTASWLAAGFADNQS